MWQHTILEIYSNKETGVWPNSGTPAEWIANREVGYCDGRLQDVIALTPLHHILYWKLCHIMSTIWWTLTWRFRRVEFEWED